MARSARHIPNCFTIAELAKRLSVSTKTVRRWIESGELRHHRLGGAIRISDEDAATFMATRRR